MTWLFLVGIGKGQIASIRSARAGLFRHSRSQEQLFYGQSGEKAAMRTVAVNENESESLLFNEFFTLREKRWRMASNAPAQAAHRTKKPRSWTGRAGRR
ncbi:hypothetical protein GIV19_19320 [Pseudomonas syringae]|uniref:hypothetical protein n=1 Tax=Pseudomonas syringae TaxID=317 RepID=UPI001F1616F6|nr:hypothetical protein [Pseudomonas syringae]MCF5709417.1 hypothetical protein [Pseudomonas syringae]